MFITIEPYQHHRYAQLLAAMFASRRSGRTVGAGEEACRTDARDLYDDLLPLYLIDTDLGVTDVFASARLLPSTGPTVSQPLIRFGDEHTISITSPAIWEASWVHLGETDDPAVRDRQFRRLVMACHRVGARCGIESLLMVLDDDQFDCCTRSGARIDLLGSCPSRVSTTLALVDITASGIVEVRRRHEHEQLAARGKASRGFALPSFATPGRRVCHTASRAGG